MSRRLVLVLLLVLAGCAFIIPQPSLDSIAPGAPPPMHLLAGAARFALTPVDHPVPLAGFGPRPPLSSRVEAPLHVRAVSLRGTAEIASGTDRVVLVSVDMLVVTRSVAGAVRALTRDLERTLVIVTATHTHFGIGGFWRGALPEWASVGRYDAAETARVVSCIAACVHSAVAAERPVTVTLGRTRLPELVESRVAHSHIVDADLMAVALDALDGPVARLVFFASHPTELYGLGALSPSWPGAFSHELERAGGVALLFQQGLGDQRPHMDPKIIFGSGANTAAVYSSGRIAKSHAYGEAIARATRDALAASKERHETLTVRVARARYELPPPTLGACPIPILDRVLAVPIVLPYWPRRTWVSALRVGGSIILFAPFELCAPSSNRAKARLREAGFGDAAVVSLADDWLGYAPDFVPLPWTTSGAASFGGAGIGYSVADRLAELGERLR